MQQFHSNVLSRFPRVSNGGARAGYAGCISGPHRRASRGIIKYALIYVAGLVTGAAAVVLLAASL